ncbi:PEGA domain-containing protein [Corallococcus praedator]|uniref:PEGA domain-containing protein n=1 Tax=Corallococcus praedator TaxID=2316724 RepID=A0ABX9QHH7_9BACT|nr:MULTISPECIES: serine/threonine-protein kinase [Corallococcus]RKH34228.1 PEGA domain-containing protein [Corallococcus sp. CA031C]RKI08197.1 PEGA domain-containing protein [Corallococcus praedator]
MTTSQPKRQPIPFGKYLLLDRVNIGGMAEVWRGKQFGASGFERLVAIKRILPNIAEDEEFISMFIDEAKISVQLTHANIAQIYELGQIASSYFISMEYIPGKDMRAIFDRCRKKGEPAPVPLVAFCVAKMCEGLDYAHRKKDGMGRELNIVHRDISPQNVLVSFEGEVKVIDFGIAKAAGKATKTQAGILKGKFGYMSPEQIRGLPLDRRSDVFAIGVCLYEMLTGERLFVGDSDFSVLEKVRKAEVPSPSTYNRRIPEALERIVLKALAKDVDERYQYASELGDDLQRFLLTSDSIFSRKDLMQYMKSTFAEEVEREKQRLAEYADIRAPDGMLAAIEAGYSGPSPVPTQSMTNLPAVQPSSAPAVEPVYAPPQPRASSPNASSQGQGARRSPTLAALPKLTAAPAAPSPKEDEELATQMVDRDAVFNDAPEPTTQPGAAVGRAVTPLESRAAAHEEDEEEEEPRTLPPSSSAYTVGPPRLSHNNMPVLNAAPPRPSLTNVPTLMSHDAPSPRPTPNRAGEGQLPRIVRPDSPPEPMPAPQRPPAPPVLGNPPRPYPPKEARSKDVVEEDASPGPGLGLRGLDKRLLYSAIGLASLLLLVGMAVVFKPSSPSLGYVMVELKTPEAKSCARVTINTGVAEPFPDTGFILKQVPVGNTLVVVSCSGFEPFNQNVMVAEGTSAAPVRAVLQRQARSVVLVLKTRPDDAEVKIDGKVARAQGARESVIRDFSLTSDTPLVEVSSPGHQPFVRNMAVKDGALDLSATLERADLEVVITSNPPGAAIYLGNKDLGVVTPNPVRVPPGTRELTLKAKCHSDEDVDVVSSTPGAVIKLDATLKKQARCRD